MKLYHSPTTPFGRKVMVHLIETGQAKDVTVIAVAGTPTSPGTMPVDQNPLGKIPALVLDDGTAIYDSRVITRYLDELWGAGLYPADRLWDVLTLEAAAEGILDSGLLMSYEVRLRPDDRQWSGWLDAQWAKIANALDMLEPEAAALGARPLDMGQVALGCALGYLDFRHDARGWRTGHPQLADWYARFAQRPSMQATKPG